MNMHKFILVISISINSIVLSHCLNFCGDWTQYKDIKCIKVLDKKDTHEAALNECIELHNNSSLITIYDQDEQQFLNKLLEKLNIHRSIWLGMKYNGNSYDWVDGTDSNFTNWSDESVRSGYEPCVQMSLMNGMLGKWIDSTCNRRALIVCQKKQELSLNSLRYIMENMTSLIEKQNLEMENVKKIYEKQQDEINFLIPLGFLYTQLPNQSSPQQLWPNMNWSEVTQKYSGLFFRAEGGDSEKFGIIQHANQSWISNSFAKVFIKSSGYENIGYSEEHCSLGEKNWTKMDPGFSIYDIELFTTGGEIRPKNTAIKIWKRIE